MMRRGGQPPREVEKYVEKISASDDRYDLYMELGMWKHAADTAYRDRDLPRLQEVNYGVTSMKLVQATYFAWLFL